MNLKYYLRGLGLGIIVTALILGIHYKVSGNNTMTDAQIKQRAEQLGMIDGNTKLVSDDTSAEKLLEELEESQKDEVEAPKKEQIDPVDLTKEDENADDAAVDDDESKDAEEETKTVEIENTRIDTVTDAADDPDRKPDTKEETSVQEDEKPADTNSEEETKTEENNIEETKPDEQTKPAEDEKKTDDEKPVSTGASTTLVISSGDSSDRVARKLAELGLVLDASDYDTFLCTYGYDRLIRVGTYSIPDGSSNEDIAKIITGKQ